MSVGSNDTQVVVVRVLFQILTEGDRLKMDAVSNVSPTGGGARDLRFRPGGRVSAVLQEDAARGGSGTAWVHTD